MIRLLLILCLFCAACNKKEAPTPLQIVRINLNTEPTSLDPRTTRNSDGMIILHMLFEGLLRSSVGGEVELAIADEMQVSENGLKYVFHLRKSDWSDGSPLTSHDFASSWKAILDPSFSTDIAYHLYPIKNAKKVKQGAMKVEELGIQTPDPYTLIVELEEPTPYFRELLTMFPYFPVSEKVVSTNPRWALEADSFVSNGPFQMKSWNHTDQISLTKNPRYWEAKEVRLDGVDLVVASADTALRMFEEGKLDWTGSPLGVIPIDAISELKQEKKLQVNPFLATYFLRTNTAEKIGDKQNPLSLVSMRRALALSVDRAAIVEHLLQGGQQPAKGLVPPEMALNSTGYFADDDLLEARKLLKRAREEAGFPIEPIVFSYYNNERNASIAQALQKQWQEKLGIAVEIEAVEPKTFFQRVSKKEFQLANGSWTADFNDPVNFLEVFKYKENGTNNTGWENLRYIDLLNRSTLCRDLEERKQLLRDAESVLMDEMPLIPIFHFALIYLKRDDLEGVGVSPLGRLDLRCAHWEMDQPSLQKR